MTPNPKLERKVVPFRSNFRTLPHFLFRSSKKASQVTNLWSQMVMELRAEVSALRRRLARKDSDLRGLLEVLRRLREFDNCTTHGIHFFELSETDIFGDLEM